MRIPRPWTGAAVALLLGAVPLGAQEKPAEKPADQPAEGRADKQAEKPAAKAKADPSASASADGFVIQSENGDYRLRIGGYAQGDGRFYLSDESTLGTDTFLLRRARPRFVGTVAQGFDFYLIPDFGGGQAVIQDAYLDARFSSAFRLRVGKFKTPSGLEQSRNDSNRKGKGPLQGLGFGGSAQFGDQSGTTLPTYRSPGQLAFFSYVQGVSVDGTRRRYSPQAYYYLGPVVFLGEYAVSTTPLVKGSVTGRVKAEAWQAAASLLLTPKEKAFLARAQVSF